MDEKQREFEKLKKKWDKKLADSGFRDIEHWNKHGEASSYFKGPGGRASTQICEIYDKERENYFRLASIFLNDVDWTTIRLKRCTPQMACRIWDLWCQGQTGVQIADELGKEAMRDYKKFLTRERKAKKGPKKGIIKRRDGLKRRWFERKIKQIEAEMYFFHKYDVKGQLYHSDF